MRIVYLITSIIFYGAYLIYDTQLIVGGRRRELTLDDYVIGALILYLDIIKIILKLLELCKKKEDNEECKKDEDKNEETKSKDFEKIKKIQDNPFQQITNSIFNIDDLDDEDEDE